MSHKNIRPMSKRLTVSNTSLFKFEVTTLKKIIAQAQNLPLQFYIFTALEKKHRNVLLFIGPYLNEHKCFRQI
jgi:hypothetical protein